MCFFALRLMMKPCQSVRVMSLESYVVQEREAVVERNQPREIAGSLGRRDGRYPRTHCWGTNAKGKAAQVVRNVLDARKVREMTISAALKRLEPLVMFQGD
jgi:hypothetical protein